MCCFILPQYVGIESTESFARYLARDTENP